MSNEPRDPSRIPIPGGSRAPYQPGDPRSGHRGGGGVDPGSQGDGLGIVGGRQVVRLDPRSFLRFLWTGEITAQIGLGLQAVPGSQCELQVRLAPGFKFNKDGQIAPSQSTSVRVVNDVLIATPSTAEVTDPTDGSLDMALARLEAAISGAVAATEVTVDFGAFDTTATTVVTGLTWVTATTKLVASVFGTEDALLDQITVTVTDRVAGDGFTVIAHAPNGSSGTHTVHVVGV